MTTKINPDRKFLGTRVRLYFKLLTDEDIQDLITACEEELELRSQMLLNES